MTNKTLQYLIYNQLYSASMYELLALQAPTKILENQMKLFQEETLNNASYLDRYYQELNTSSYHPIIQEPVNHGSFKKEVDVLLKEKIDKDDFSEKLKREMMYYFWSKCEYEIILSPWTGRADNIKIDI